MTVHMLTGEYGSNAGGVGAYATVLTDALTRHGVSVRVWDTHDPALRRALPAALQSQPGYVLLQYVPNALGARGANVTFCRWLLSLRQGGADVRVMFHEPYFYLSWNPALSALAMVQRLMATILLRASSRVYVSTEQWCRYLTPYAPAATTFTVLPVPSTLPHDPPAASVAGWRSRISAAPEMVVGHFGTFGDHVANALYPMVPALLQAVSDVQFVCIGRGGQAFVSRLAAQHPSLAPRVHATGPLERSDAAAAIAACDVALQPYPDGVTTRRTSVMAPLSLGVATVTSQGFLTESLWSQRGGIALAAAPDVAGHVAAAVSLLRDASARRHLANTGRQVYSDHFAIHHTVNALLGAAVV